MGYSGKILENNIPCCQMLLKGEVVMKYINDAGYESEVLNVVEDTWKETKMAYAICPEEFITEGFCYPPYEWKEVETELPDCTNPIIVWRDIEAFRKRFPNTRIAEDDEI